MVNPCQRTQFIGESLIPEQKNNTDQKTVELCIGLCKNKTRCWFSLLRQTATKKHPSPLRGTIASKVRRCQMVTLCAGRSREGGEMGHEAQNSIKLVNNVEGRGNKHVHAKNTQTNETKQSAEVQPMSQAQHLTTAFKKKSWCLSWALSQNLSATDEDNSWRRGWRSKPPVCFLRNRSSKR